MEAATRPAWLAAAFGVLALPQPGFSEGDSNQWLPSVHAMPLAWISLYLLLEQVKSFSEWSGMNVRERGTA